MSKFKERLKKDQKGMIRYIYAVLFISIIVGVLVNYLVDVVFCAFFAGIGTFFLILMCVNLYNSWRYTRESVHTKAVVTACERMKTEGEDEDEGDDYYYKITYEVEYQGEKVVVELPSYEKYKVGKKLGVYYIHDKNVLRTEVDMEDFRSSKGLKILVVIFFAAAVIAGVLGNMESLTESFWSKVMAGVVGVVFSSFGIWELLVKFRRKKEYMEAYRVPATLKRFIVRRSTDSDGHRHKSYFPVWEYFYNGEYKEHKSSVSRKKNQDVGTESEVFFTLSGDTYEKSEAKASFTIGVIFTILGVAMLLVAIFAPL